MRKLLILVALAFAVILMGGNASALTYGTYASIDAPDGDVGNEITIEVCRDTTQQYAVWIIGVGVNEMADVEGSASTTCDITSEGSEDGTMIFYYTWTPATAGYYKACTADGPHNVVCDNFYASST